MHHRGGGEALPIDDDSFDAAFELGVLHHVAELNAIVGEMMRVARRAIFRSDDNRFAKGGPLRRAAKYALHRLGVRSAVYRLAQRGRTYYLTEGVGGVAYSYSVYDSVKQLAEWADRIFFV